MMSGTTSRLKHRLAVLIIKPSLLISQDLLLSLIKKDPVDRLSAGEALKHSWFQEDEEACKVARDIMLNTEDSVRVSKTETDQSASSLSSEVSLLDPERPVSEEILMAEDQVSEEILETEDQVSEEVLETEAEPSAGISPL